MVLFLVLAAMLVTELYAYGGAAINFKAESVVAQSCDPPTNIGICSSVDVSQLDGCGFTIDACTEMGVADSGFCDEYFADSGLSVFTKYDSTANRILCIIVWTTNCATGAQQDLLSVGAAHVAGDSGTFSALPEWVWGMCIGFVASFIVMLMLIYVKDQRATCTKSQYVSIDDGGATIKLLQ